LGVLEEFAKFMFPPYALIKHPVTQEFITEPENLGVIFPPLMFAGDNPPFWDTTTKMKSGLPLGKPLVKTKASGYPQYGELKTYIPFNFPSLPDIGKWVLYGGVAIAGIYLLGKAIK